MSELRKDPVLDRWTLVSPERAARPSEYLEQGPERVPRQSCPFCPGREHETPHEIFADRSPPGPPDGPGWRVRLVPNRFPALTLDAGAAVASDPFFVARPGVGAHEVLIETPDHDADLGSMGVEQATLALRALRQRIAALGREPRLAYVMAFENHGAAAGATIEHAHAQILALDFVPRVIRVEMENAAAHHARGGQCIYCEWIERERRAASRVIRDGGGFLTAAAYAPRFEYEAWIAPLAHASSFERGGEEQDAALARALTDAVARLQSVLDHPAYNFILHTAPCRSEDIASYHWHVEVLPRTARLAGFEWGSGVHIVATPPEEAAARLAGVALSAAP